MSKFQLEAKKEVTALQRIAKIEINSNPEQYRAHIQKLNQVLNDVNQLSQWVGLATKMEINNLLAHIATCCVRVSESYPHDVQQTVNAKRKQRDMRRRYKQVYIDAISDTIDARGSAQSPAIAPIGTVTTMMQGSVI